MARVYALMSSARAGAACSSVCGLLALLAIASALPAQTLTVRGQVVDARTLMPIRYAAVVIEPDAEGGDRRWVALSDTSGNFAIALSATDSAFVVTTRKIGYEPIEALLPATALKSDMRIEMRSLVTTLPTVTTSATFSPAAKVLYLAGFLDRRKMGMGTFLDTTDIDKSNAMDLQDFLRPYMGSCARIWVDGVRFIPLQMIVKPAVVGVEIYRSVTSTPIEFQLPGSSAKPCRTILIWTGPR